MPKAVKVKVDRLLLEQALGMDNFAYGDVHIYHAQIDNERWGNPTLELILTGDGLDDFFTVREGDVVKEGDFVMHSTYIRSEILPVENR